VKGLPRKGEGQQQLSVLARSVWEQLLEVCSFGAGLQIIFQISFTLNRCPSGIHQNIPVFTEKLLKNSDANVLTVEFAFLFFLVII